MCRGPPGGSGTWRVGLTKPEEAGGRGSQQTGYGLGCVFSATGPRVGQWGDVKTELVACGDGSWTHGVGSILSPGAGMEIGVRKRPVGVTSQGRETKLVWSGPTDTRGVGGLAFLRRSLGVSRVTLKRQRQTGEWMGGERGPRDSRVGCGWACNFRAGLQRRNWRGGSGIMCPEVRAEARGVSVEGMRAEERTVRRQEPGQRAERERARWESAGCSCQGPQPLHWEGVSQVLGQVRGWGLDGGLQVVQVLSSRVSSGLHLVPSQGGEGLGAGSWGSEAAHPLGTPARPGWETRVVGMGGCRGLTGGRAVRREAAWAHLRPVLLPHPHPSFTCRLLWGPSWNCIQGSLLQKPEHPWGLQRGGRAAGGSAALTGWSVWVRQRVTLVSPTRWRSHIGLSPVAGAFLQKWLL